MDSHCEEAMKSAIVRSGRGQGAHEIYRIYSKLRYYLDWYRREIWEGPSTDNLQQEYYQLQQVKGEKIQQIASRLETKYWKLEENFPERYDHKHLKDRLFYGMHQHLRDSIRLLYIQELVSYEDMLIATREAEMKWTEN